MPVYSLHCPDCEHDFKGLVLAGTQVPAEWVCSVCGGKNAARSNLDEREEHPLEVEHGAGCPCCG